MAPPYDYAEARRLADELELADPVAIALVRRGHRTVEAARRFLEADEAHDPELFEGISTAVGSIRSALAAGGRITIHGDYDVDGICSTAILVGALRRAGAECDWIIPDRLADGYGLTAATVDRLAERGTRLLITADCGIGSVEEVAALRAAGIDVVVSDHHQPGERLPDCPIVHPVVSGYPFEGLCGAAVAHKLVGALERELGRRGRGIPRSRPRGAGDDRRSRPAGRREPLARQARDRRAPARPAPRAAGADGGGSRRAGATRRGRRRLPARPAPERGGSPLPCRRRRRADADRRPRPRRGDRSASSTPRTTSGARPNAGCPTLPRRLCARFRTSFARRPPWCWRARAGIRASSASSPRGSSSGTAGRRSCSRSTTRAGPGDRGGAFPASTCSRRSRRAAPTSSASAGTALRRGWSSTQARSRASAKPSSPTPARSRPPEGSPSRSGSTPWSGRRRSTCGSPSSSDHWPRSDRATPGSGCWSPPHGSGTCSRWGRRASTPGSG